MALAKLLTVPHLDFGVCLEGKKNGLALDAAKALANRGGGVKVVEQDTRVVAIVVQHDKEVGGVQV